MGRAENRIERRLVAGIKELGGKTFKFVSPGEAGVPDRIVILPGGEVHFVELKSETGSLSALQKRRISRLRELGVTALVLKGGGEVERYLDNCRELMNE